MNNMSNREGTSDNYLLKTEDSEFKVYPIRWLMVILFILSGVANSLLLLSWSPISDLANVYWGGIGLTAINLLNVIFEIAYIPGTLLALYVSKHYKLKSLMIVGGSLTTVGCIIRWIGTYSYSSGSGGLSAVGSYSVVLLGTIFGALSQPFYLNMPAKIANTWFAVKERDIATTLCSLANPLGSAIGSLIPPMFVKSSYLFDDISGVSGLTLTQLIVAIIALGVVVLLFQSEPISPPSNSESIKSQNESSGNNKNFKQEFFQLMGNNEYIKLLLSFTIALGNLNALAALLGQLPDSFSNGQIGATGFALILSGFLGAFLGGILLEKTKAYRPILKYSWMLAVVTWAIFTCSVRSGSFIFFIIAGAFLGFTLLPIIPATIMNAVECAYPVSEDLALGLLYIGANTMAIAMTFIGQVLLAYDPDSAGPSPLYPYSIWSTGTMILGLVPIILYNGKYLRLNQDLGTPILSNRGDENIH